MTVKAVDSATIGSLSRFRFEIQNTTEEPIVLLEIDPDQPCEDSISLIRSLYGNIRFDEKRDEYIYDPLQQSKTSIPVSEGFLPPGEKWSLELSYRPFASSETFQIQYARASGAPVYRKRFGNAGDWSFSRKGTDSSLVILPSLAGMPKEIQQIVIAFEGLKGKENPKCFCQTLKQYVDEPPFSLYKEWDAGQTVEFKVGDKQNGIDPDRKSAGWKFLDRYDVIFGDGMYTHGEFVRISAADAPEFWKRIHGKYAIKRINYFFTDHYYDLEPFL